VKIWEDGFYMGMQWASHNRDMADQIEGSTFPDAAARAWMDANAEAIQAIRTAGDTELARENARTPTDTSEMWQDKKRAAKAASAVPVIDCGTFTGAKPPMPVVKDGPVKRK
jgi:hypothetical protein